MNLHEGKTKKTPKNTKKHAKIRKKQNKGFLCLRIFENRFDIISSPIFLQGARPKIKILK